MKTFFTRETGFIRKRHYTIIVVLFLSAAALTGMCCVFFMWGFDFVQRHRLDFQSAGPWCWLTTPLVFSSAVFIIQRFAPFAAGTGIPQVAFAAEHLNQNTENRISPLVSPRTLIVKVFALLAIVWVGASTGREGPTVHIATCIFLLVVSVFRRWFGLKVDLRSAVVAGGAAGLASAFNTPLAGVTFAIEELTPDFFSSIKDFVLLAIIVAAVIAKTFTGEYAYFGQLPQPESVPLGAILLIGVVCGLLGALFSSAILSGRKLQNLYASHFRIRWLWPIALSLGLLLIALVFGTKVLGPGNEAAKQLLDGEVGNWTRAFPYAKMASTLFTYWSGAAGGIFAPCLSIGSGIGANIAHWMNAPLASCALIGMAAFLAGTIQAPMTSFVIVFEMTGHHQMLLPIMLASLIAVMTARIAGGQHLYKTLAKNYLPLLEALEKVPS